jgi:hypothetical protein
VLPDNDLDAMDARKEMINHPQVQALALGWAKWEKRPIQCHNDSNHSIYKLSTLADFGLRFDDPGRTGIVETILSGSDDPESTG